MASRLYLKGGKVLEKDVPLTYEDGVLDATNIQQRCRETGEAPEEIWVSPEEAMNELAQSEKRFPELCAYWRGYLSRWD